MIIRLSISNFAALVRYIGCFLLLRSGGAVVLPLLVSPKKFRFTLLLFRRHAAMCRVRPLAIVSRQPVCHKILGLIYVGEEVLVEPTPNPS